MAVTMIILLLGTDISGSRCILQAIFLHIPHNFVYGVLAYKVGPVDLMALHWFKIQTIELGEVLARPLSVIGLSTCSGFRFS